MDAIVCSPPPVTLLLTLIFSSLPTLSGAGKTTLLDCLTGHRKHGLSGSIRISTSGASAHRRASSSATPDKLRPASLAGSAKRRPNWACQPSQTGDNLKVSIIPQNDHLMGHLTVYETLNYASKMKNCFDKSFDHKPNIKRVAHQLGLLSCLATRINKLSGGQYKRVSIAQELLSSPDILILDEPTSGLDAMTCYQTVQVLRRLTQPAPSLQASSAKQIDQQVAELEPAELATHERQDGQQHLPTCAQSRQKQIAVILTIHQPNSDVFQQFNHVYVVAQGGKCIFEGSPQSIESVINRVGIRLPNSYYNPATMIVEIAAAKFGLDAIQKLNSIQKKQYQLVMTQDEQNSSTGDSAVDCPSSSNDDNDDEDEDDHHDHDHDHNREQPTDKACTGFERSQVNVKWQPASEPLGYQVRLFTGSHQTVQPSKPQDDNNNTCRLTDVAEINNNSKAPVGSNKTERCGLINRGFVMDSGVELELKGGRKDNVIVIVSGSPKSDHVEDADSLDKMKSTSHYQDGATGASRKKRRRTRKRSGDLHATVTPSLAGGAGDDAGDGGGGGGGGGGGAAAGGREKRLKLNSLKADQRFPFWRHTYLHFHRSWLSIVRDPMLCSMQLALHVIVPLMVSLVYGTNVGKPNACPRAGPTDILAYALEPTDAALQLQEDLRTTLENIGYIFFKLYGIIFAAMTVTVLTFPLDMHVLVKEFRNGWYGLSSYFLGRTLADIPFQLTLPLLAMSLSYYATGQPYSFMQWRFLSITAILILSSLIAQSQGLLFGAILMDKMKAAVFVAPAATTPIILFAGFLVRTQSIPRYLRPLSNLSYLRYAIEACLISRYGFNQCECNPAVFNQTVPELPPIARSMLDYWLSSFKPSSASDGLNETSSLIETTTLPQTSEERPDLFTKLIDSLAKANSFGRNITSCEQVVPYPMIDYDLKDSQLFTCFAILIFMLVFTRLLTFFIVCFKVKRKV